MRLLHRSRSLLLGLRILTIASLFGSTFAEGRSSQPKGHAITPHESPVRDPWMSRSSVIPPEVEIRCEPVVLGEFRSVQVNVDAIGCNIPGDAANEPSIAIDPSNPRRIAIGWRQFDMVESSFREAGVAYSHDGGHTWVFPGVLSPGVFHSDPVLESDADGNFFFLGIRCAGPQCGEIFKSIDGGITWADPVPARVGDKPWIAVDRTGGIGHGNIYAAASGDLVRSIDGGATFQWAHVANFGWSSLAIGPIGQLHLGYDVSFDAADPTVFPPTVEEQWGPDFDGGPDFGDGPNPNGILGQRWLAYDHSLGPFHGTLFALRSVNPPGDDPLDVRFTRSDDDGYTWSTSVRVNDVSDGWQWFGMMSVAPNGRIDAAWNDTSISGQDNLSALRHAYSFDAGTTWIQTGWVSPVFDSHIGWPYNQWKIGDYYHMISDNLGVNIAYAATFNGEHDIYFLRIGPYDCNGNEIPDENDITDGASLDCNTNDVPDECEYRGDFNGDRLTGLYDHAAYVTCRTEPGAPTGAPCCGLFDIEPDGDADLADFAFLQRAFAVHGP